MSYFVQYALLKNGGKILENSVKINLKKVLIK